MTRHQEATRRLDDMAVRLAERLADAAVVERDGVGGAEIRPRRDGALGVYWVLFKDEMLLGTSSGLGGRWELGLEDVDLDFLEDVVTSVIAGRVVAVRVGDRSRVEVTLEDGTLEVDTGRRGLRSLLPKPFWQSWGNRITYLPYVAEVLVAAHSVDDMRPLTTAERRVLRAVVLAGAPDDEPVRAALLAQLAVAQVTGASDSGHVILPVGGQMTPG